MCGIRTVRVEWSKEEDGRWRMDPVAGTEKVFPCDLVLLALGFLGPEHNITDQLQLSKDQRTNIETPAGKFRTNISGVFAAGGTCTPEKYKITIIIKKKKTILPIIDCHRGQSLVVWAIAEGRQAAREVDQFLMGESILPGLGGVIDPSHLQHS